MSSLSRELVFLIFQFLDEEKYKDTVHKLEQESGYFFNMKYLEELALAGEWDEVEKYLLGFTKVDDNRYSMKIFFEIRKQKYLEALDRQDRSKAVEILVKDLKVFSTFNEDLYKEITHLLILDNFRENGQLSKYGDTKSARSIMLLELKKLIEANPLFRDKLMFPVLKASRLRTLINQSLNWQHQICKNPRPNPDIKTLFTDHTCTPSNGARAPPPPNNPLVGLIPKGGPFTPLGAHGAFPPAAATSVNQLNPLAGWIASPNLATPPHAVVAAGPPAAAAPPNQAMFLKQPRTPPGNNSGIDYQTADSQHLLKRGRPAGPVDEVTFPVATLPQASFSLDDLPKVVARTLNQGSSITSMDFHPLHQTLLLVGTNVGDIAIWEVSSKERLIQRPFKVWDLPACSMPLQAALVKDPAVVVNKTTWSPDGQIFGVAFSKHIVHVYNYHGGSDVHEHLEIDAHAGGVNDLAFSHPSNQPCIVTCGDDKTIKVWEAASGRKMYCFEGHEVPVFSVCPHQKENIQFIFSTAVDGKIKAWLYDNMGSRVDYDAPGHSCTTMAYSADGTRLFSCGTSKEGESFLVEWNESEGAIKRTYFGFRKRSLGVVKFDTTRNRFLAAGDDFQIKFWDMDNNTNILTATDADGGLPAIPRLRFNKEGSLLAVTTNDNGIKILANADGLQFLVESQSFEISRGQPDFMTSKALPINPMGMGAPGVPASSGIAAADRLPTAVTVSGLITSVQNGNDANCNSVDVKPARLPEDVPEKVISWKMTEIIESSHCRLTHLPDTLQPAKVSRLIYTNSGSGVLALCSNAVHKLWKWHRNEHNPLGKATASVSPQLWKPPSGILMTNEINDINPEEQVPCIALSKNDSYVMSASGGKVSLFNMMTFKVMTTFSSPPPAATFLAFHPQDNNVIAIGMSDSTIQIYNVRVDEVKTRLKGHQKRISGLAFSNILNILISAGADSQIFVWGTESWDKRNSKFVQIPPGTPLSSSADTKVQFHNDQTRLLVVHESQIAIYDAAKLERLKQWIPRDSMSASVSNAVFSCDSQLVYASLTDGSVGVFDTDSLRPRCRVAPSVYLPPGLSSTAVYPLSIAAHPTEPSQFAIGLTNGGVEVIEPLEADGKWGTSPPLDNGKASTSNAANLGSEQGPR